MSAIFSAYAPFYWAKGLPVIPLHRWDATRDGRKIGKAPMFQNWTQWADRMPTEAEQTNWLAAFQEHNLGLPCGPQSGLIMIDIDSDDPKIQKAILEALPNTPWKRIGAKGMMLAYKSRSFTPGKIHDPQGRPYVEIMGHGNQIVLPPSIHPDIAKPYTSDTNLWEVMDQVPFAPDHLEDRLRSSISQVAELRVKGARGQKYNASRVVPKGERDVAQTQFAGKLASSILAGDLPLLRALEDMRGWQAGYLQKDSKDNIDTEKGVNQIVRFLMTDVSKGKILPPSWDEGLTPEVKTQLGLDSLTADQQEWTESQILDYIVEQYTDTKESDEKRKLCQRFVIQKVAQSRNLDGLAIDKIAKKLKGGDADLHVGTIKKMIKEAQQGPLEGDNHTEIAKAMIDELQERWAMMAYAHDKIYSWTGSCWQERKEQELRVIVQNDYGSLALGKRLSDHKAVVDVIKDQVQQGLTKDDFIEGINFSNGFLNRDLQLVPHAPEQGMTYTLPFSYTPELAGKMPHMWNYINSSWGQDEDRDDKIKALQEAICVTLFGAATSYQRAFLLYGTPASGKSVLMNIIAAMVPESATSAMSPYDWGTNRFATAQFEDKLINLCGELSETKLIDGQNFKQVVSGETIAAENKGADFFKFKPKCAHWFCSNYLPKTRDITAGFGRRWLIFRFNHRVPEDKIIRDLDKIIVQNEIEAIVAWALEAWPGLVERGIFTEPSSHVYYSEEMALGNSSVRQWMRESVVPAEGRLMLEADAYHDYWTWTSTKGTRTVSSKRFSNDLQEILNEMGKPGAFFENGQNQYKNWVLRGKK